LLCKLRSIVLRLINRADGRVELIEDDGEQFVHLDKQKIGRSLQLYAGMDRITDGLGLADFAELVLTVEATIGAKNHTREDMRELVHYVSEDKRATWLAIWG